MDDGRGGGRINSNNKILMQSRTLTAPEVLVRNQCMVSALTRGWHKLVPSRFRLCIAVSFERLHGPHLSHLKLWLVSFAESRLKS